MFTIITQYKLLKTEKKTAKLKLSHDSIDDIISSMSISEKASMLSGYYKLEYDAPDENGNRAECKQQIKDAAGCTQSISKYGIPSTHMIDGPAGIRFKPFERNGKKVHATAYPIATLLASSWDEVLLEDVGRALGCEASTYDIDLLLAPALNIQRNPLGGRNFEYYSEDPLLSGKMASAMVKGIQSCGVGATVKHFAVNNQETDRMTIDTVVDERTLREIYLRSFEIAVKESKPWAVMSAYNKINGDYAAEKKELLTDILRGEWKFDGLVMTDWGQKGRFYLVTKAQNDLVMPHGDIWDVIRLHDVGYLHMDEIDRCLKNILNFILKTQTYKKYFRNGYSYEEADDMQFSGGKSNAEISRRAAVQGMVLLKNENNVLPFQIAGNQKAALYGINQNRPTKGGNGSGDVHAAHTVSLREGFDRANICLNAQVKALYRADMEEELLIDYKSAAKHAEDTKTKMAVISIGRSSGEENDRKAVKGDYYLSDTEQVLIETVSKAYREAGKKVVVVLNIVGVIDIESWKASADAILLAWQPGQECGDAILDVLTGKVNPSGKLPMTFAKSYEDYPCSGSFPGNGLSVKYEEGLYVGYRYFTTWDCSVTYEFGYGLSYSEFLYSDIQANTQLFRNKINISLAVTNTGNYAGREVVQLYIRAPEKRLEKPRLELKAFAKTQLLQPGQSELITLSLDSDKLKSFDVETAQWIIEAGEYEASIGASCLDIRGQVCFSIENDIAVEQMANRVCLKQKMTTMSHQK